MTTDPTRIALISAGSALAGVLLTALFGLLTEVLRRRHERRTRYDERKREAYADLYLLVNDFVTVEQELSKVRATMPTAETVVSFEQRYEALAAAAPEAPREEIEALAADLATARRESERNTGRLNEAQEANDRAGARIPQALTAVALLAPKRVRKAVKRVEVVLHTSDTEKILDELDRFMDAARRDLGVR